MFTTEGNGMYRPRMLLAVANSAYAAECGRYFRRNGWEVHVVVDGAEFQQQVELYCPGVLVLDAALVDDSARLFWDEWLEDQGGLKVVLIVPKQDAKARQLQEILHASAMVAENDPVEKLAEAILGHRLAQAV